MSLQYLETNVIGGYLVDAWQNHLQTESDPTSGKWFRQGPDNSVGLFGGLTDILITDLTFDPGQSNINKSKDVALSTTLDNRAGLLNESPATNTLSWQVTNSATTSHTQSHAVKNTLTTKYSAKATVPGVAEVTKEITWGFEYSFSWSETEAVTQTETKTFTTSIPLKVPQGKAYKLVVLADRNSLTIPYHARIRIKGVSEANFDHAINGQTRWSANAGTVCSWIDQYGSAKDDAMTFGADPANPADGIGDIKGLMRVDQSVNFTIFAIDVTSTLTADPSSSAAIGALLKGEALPADQVVTATPVAA